MQDDKYIQSRKIILIADQKHNSPNSISIVRLLSDLAHQGFVALGLENYYWGSNFDDRKHCYGLENPYIHCFVDQLNKLSQFYILREQYKGQPNQLRFSAGKIDYHPPAYADPQQVNWLQALVTQADSLEFLQQGAQFTKEAQSETAKPNHFYMRACERARLLLRTILKMQLFEHYQYQMSLDELGLEGVDYKDSQKLREYVVKKLNPTHVELIMKYKMELRDSVMAHYAKQICEITPDLPLVLFVGAEHLDHLSLELAEQLPNHKILMVRQLSPEVFSESREEDVLDRLFAADLAQSTSYGHNKRF